MPADAIIRPTLVSLAGGMLMLSDKAAVYRDDTNLEGAKAGVARPFHRAGPTHDFDPSKSDNVVKLDCAAVKAGTLAAPSMPRSKARFALVVVGNRSAFRALDGPGG